MAAYHAPATAIVLTCWPFKVSLSSSGVLVWSRVNAEQDSEELQQRPWNLFIWREFVFGAFRHLAQRFLIFRQIKSNPGHEAISVRFPFVEKSI